MSNGAAGKGNLRLRSGKNYLPGWNVLSRLHKQLHAIARKTSTGRKLPVQACAPSHFSDPPAFLVPSQSGHVKRLILLGAG